MGKRRKRLTMPKYAKKYASLRKAVFGLKQQAQEVVEEVVETVLEKAVVVAEKAEQVLDQTQERVNALRFTNEQEVIQVEEPKAEETIAEQPKVTRPAQKTQTPQERNLLLQLVKEEPTKQKQTPRLFVPSNN